jgi:hypothetical protein
MGSRGTAIESSARALPIFKITLNRAAQANSVTDFMPFPGALG